jgi:spermidine synthase
MYRPIRDLPLSALFAFTLFVGAALLFWVQPMFAKMVLPLLGGSPAVWNTCAVFFQAALLAGYGYAHLAPARFGVRRHAALHLGLMFVPLLVLPLGVPASWNQPYNAPPILWLLALLTVAVGLPFFVVSTTAPLLQTWFAQTGRPSAKDPYFLYAASNLGGLAALLSYPLLLEPSLALSTQSLLWAALYGLLVLLTLGCAVVLWWAPGMAVANEKPAPGLVDPRVFPPPASPITLLRRLRWLALAFVPSSLLLSVTTYLSTDIAAMPLLWVVPLALYLLTFSAAFARRRLVPHQLVVRVVPLTILLVAVALLSGATEPVAILLPLHLLGLGVIALACHGELARDRPDPAHLTAFYLWLALGGVLGGLFNALAAPLLFPGLAEYPLVLTLAALLLRVGPDRANAEKRPVPSRDLQFAICNLQFAIPRADLLFPLGLGILTAFLVILAQALQLPAGPVSVGVMYGLPLVVCYTFLEHALRFGLGVAVLFVASMLDHNLHGLVEYRQRSFFGVHRVTIDEAHTYRLLVHGNTVHGRQNLTSGHRRDPLTYYHRSGPAGRLFAALDQTHANVREVAVVGLGAGSLAAYGRAGQHWTFYEIDPAVVAIARDAGFFTFLHDCPATLEYVVGDARLRLEQAEGRRYDVLIIDAFGSDATPVHLLTREALQSYLARLEEGGLLALHISNRYLDLEPVLAELAHDAKLVCLTREDLTVSAEEKAEGKYPSSWMLMSRSPADVRAIRQRSPWWESRRVPGQAVWTDDFSDLLRQLK